MHINETIQKLTEMHLTGLLHALREQIQNTQYSSLSFEERIGFLVDHEYLKRKNAALARRRSAAKLKQRASFENLDFSVSRGLNKSELLNLASDSWLTQNQNLIISGPTGAGKTYLACALADKACLNGHSVLYIKLSDLTSQLVLTRADGSYPKLAAKLAKIKLLIIDEWLRDPLPQTHAREILELLDDRYQNASIALVSQLPVADWYASITSPTLADAIMDRIVHRAIRISLTGESMRKKMAENSIPTN